MFWLVFFSLSGAVALIVSRASRKAEDAQALDDERQQRREFLEELERRSEFVKDFLHSDPTAAIVKFSKHTTSEIVQRSSQSVNQIQRILSAGALGDADAHRIAGNHDEAKDAFLPFVGTFSMLDVCIATLPQASQAEVAVHLGEAEQDRKLGRLDDAKKAEARAARILVVTMRPRPQTSAKHHDGDSHGVHFLHAAQHSDPIAVAVALGLQHLAGLGSDRDEAKRRESIGSMRLKLAAAIANAHHQRVRGLVDSESRAMEGVLEEVRIFDLDVQIETLPSSRRLEVRAFLKDAERYRELNQLSDAREAESRAMRSLVGTLRPGDGEDVPA